jgi:hypothetical protein
MSTDPIAHDPLLELASTVMREAAAAGIPLAVIGALALARHGYIRATADVDFASSASFDAQLRPLAQRLRDLGLLVDVRPPDLGDPIDGMLRVRATPDSEPIDIVNFAGRRSAGALAVARAEQAPDGFAYARIPELVALKLYAGSRFDLDDVARLLAEAQDFDMDEVHQVAKDCGLADALAEALRHVDR